MPTFNAEVTGSSLPPMPTTIGSPSYDFSAVQVHGRLLAVTRWPGVNNAGSPNGLAYVVRLNEDGTASYGVPYDYGALPTSWGQHRPRWTWLDDDRVASIRLLPDGKSWTVELFAVDTATLGLSLLDSSSFTSPYASGTFSMGSISRLGVACAVSNLYVPGQAQNVIGPDTRGFAVCLVEREGINAWDFREIVMDGFHTKNSAWAISDSAFFLPWAGASGGVYEEFVYDAFTNQLRLVNRQASEEYNSALMGLDFGPAYAGSVERLIPGMPDNRMVMKSHHHDSGWSYRGFQQYVWGEFVGLTEVGLPMLEVEAYGAFELIPEYYEDSGIYASGPDTIGWYGEAYDNPRDYNTLAAVLRPDVNQGDHLYVMRWRDDPSETIAVYGAWGVEGEQWMYGMVGTEFTLMRVWPMATEPVVEVLDSQCRFW